MKCITRECSRINRIACPWLIKKMVVPVAVFIFVPNDQVFDIAKEVNGIPRVIPGAEYRHENDRCTFDYIIRKYKLTDTAIVQIAEIVRGADTDNFSLARKLQGFGQYQQD